MLLYIVMWNYDAVNQSEMPVVVDMARRLEHVHPDGDPDDTRLHKKTMSFARRLASNLMR